MTENSRELNSRERGGKDEAARTRRQGRGGENETARTRRRERGGKDEAARTRRRERGGKDEARMVELRVRTNIPKLQYSHKTKPNTSLGARFALPALSSSRLFSGSTGELCESLGFNLMESPATRGR